MCNIRCSRTSSRRGNMPTLTCDSRTNAAEAAACNAAFSAALQPARHLKSTPAQHSTVSDSTHRRFLGVAVVCKVVLLLRGALARLCEGAAPRGKVDEERADARAHHHDAHVRDGQVRRPRAEAEEDDLQGACTHGSGAQVRRCAGRMLTRGDKKRTQLCMASAEASCLQRASRRSAARWKSASDIDQWR
jgi:hypothetical protein